MTSFQYGTVIPAARGFYAMSFVLLYNRST